MRGVWVRADGRREQHGMRYHPLYKAWNGMMTRCYNQKSNCFHRYGGRGIGVHKRWHNIKNFIQDMGEKPRGTSLGRIHNDRGYSSKNCRWETKSQQYRNTRRNVFIEHAGMRLTIAEWSRKLGIGPVTLRLRKKRGLPPSRILEQVDGRSNRSTIGNTNTQRGK